MAEVAIADVDAFVPRQSALDNDAAWNMTSVYTGERVFPMLPDRLSTDLTSLREGEDRLAVVVEWIVDPDGRPHSGVIYRACVRNQARLDYETIGPWLEDSSPGPLPNSPDPDLAEQIRLQWEAADRLRTWRGRQGAPSLQRVVRSPERWPRIREVAARLQDSLPSEADPKALSAFLARRKAADPLHYPDLSLTIVKLLGPGQYAVVRSAAEHIGHFGLAATSYTHSTAPNRRYADLIVQRLLKALQGGAQAPYSEEELETFAARCTEREDAARKAERLMRKVETAALMSDRVGHLFDAIVTGVAPKGTFARLTHPPVEGRILRGQHDLDVGDRIRVRLVGADPERGFIDFERVEE